MNESTGTKRLIVEFLQEPAPDLDGDVQTFDYCGLDEPIFEGLDSRRHLDSGRVLDFIDTPALSSGFAKPTRVFKKLSILVAVYNEEATLWRCVREILAAPLPPG